MKGKINNEGILEIERAGRFKKMECRIAGLGFGDLGHDPMACLCGDDCPHFGEPEYYEKRHVIIEICQSRFLSFDEFEDQRKSDKR